MALGRSRLLLPAAVFAVGAAALLGAFALTQATPPASTGVAAIGGPFRLTAQTGATLTDRDLKGRPFAVFFGFTHCPDVCPTSLFEIGQLLQALGPDGDRLKVLFVSVDPARDTPELLATYLQSFDPRITGLTGTEAEVAAAARAYRAVYRKVPTSGGDYTMEHTATVYLMDGKGRFFSALDLHEGEAAKLAKLRRLLREG